MSVRLVLVIDEETVIDDTYATEQDAADAARAEMVTCSGINTGKWRYDQPTRSGTWDWPNNGNEHNLDFEITDV